MKRLFFLTVLFSLLFTVAAAQQIIKGKVIDAQSRQPLEAASISADEGQQSITDDEGNFTLKKTNNNLQVHVNSIGYKQNTIVINGNGFITVLMQPDIINLKKIELTSGRKNIFSTVSKIDVNIKPVRNSQELLRMVPGLFIAQHAGGGKAEQIFLRGFDVDHGTDVKISMDGMPVNMVSHAHGQGYADAHFIIPETVSNIDFGTGPYYAQQGNLNTAGYVAFNTQKSIAKSIIQTEAGRFNTFRSLAMLDLLKKNKDKQSAYIAGEFNYTNGPTIAKQNFNRINIFSKYNRQLSAATALSISASAFTSKWDASGQIPTRSVEDGSINRFGSIDPTEGGNTERYNVNGIFTSKFKNNLSIENQIWYSKYAFNLYSNFSFYLNDSIHGDGINQFEKRDLAGYNLAVTNKYFIKNRTIINTNGAGIRYDGTSNSRLSHQVKRMWLDDVKKGNITEWNAWGYTQHSISIDKWVVEAGLRYDYFHVTYFDKLTTNQLPSQQKSIISPKFNIQYNASKNIQLYAKAGKGFHSNDTRVVVANDGKEILPAAYGVDFGLTAKPIKNLYLNIAAWYLYLNQEFVYVGDDGNIEPSGKTKRTGIDIIARYQMGNNWFAMTNVNITKPRAIGLAKGEDYIPLAPTFTSTGGIYYKKQTGFTGGINYRIIKNRPANEDNTVTAKGYTVVDAAINYTKPKYEIGISAENIFNTKWNEAQFATESRLLHESMPVTELNFTPGTPLFVKLKFAVFF